MRAGIAIALVLGAAVAFGAAEDQWRREMAFIQEQLARKQYAVARSNTIRLTRSLLDGLGEGPEATRLIADLTVLRASAEEGLGNADDASWYYQVAAALDPGTAATIVSKMPTEPMSARPVPLTPNVTPPTITHRSILTRPTIIRYIGASTVTIQVVIGTDGLAHHPEIVQSPAPALSYIALEAIREWRFKPATLEGRPTPVLYNLTITFR